MNNVSLVNEALENIADYVSRNGLAERVDGKVVNYRPSPENLRIQDIEAIGNTIVFVIANRGGTTFRRAVIEYNEREDQFIGFEENEYIGQALGREFEKFTSNLDTEERLKQLYSAGKINAFVVYLKLLSGL